MIIPYNLYPTQMSNAPRNDVAPLKTIMYRAIKTTGTLIVKRCVRQRKLGAPVRSNSKKIKITLNREMQINGEN